VLELNEQMRIRVKRMSVYQRQSYGLGYKLNVFRNQYYVNNVSLAYHWRTIGYNGLIGYDDDMQDMVTWMSSL